MTIDEAIKHAEEVAEENQAIVDSFDFYGENMAKCKKCAKEHRQLAEWLKELKMFRKAFPSRSLETYDGDKDTVTLTSKQYHDLVTGLEQA